MNSLIVRSLPFLRSMRQLRVGFSASDLLLRNDATGTLRMSSQMRIVRLFNSNKPAATQWAQANEMSTTKDDDDEFENTLRDKKYMSKNFKYSNYSDRGSYNARRRRDEDEESGDEDGFANKDRFESRGGFKPRRYDDFKPRGERFGGERYGGEDKFGRGNKYGGDRFGGEKKFGKSKAGEKYHLTDFESNEKPIEVDAMKTDYHEEKGSFDKYNLPQSLLAQLKKNNFLSPFKIQEATLEYTLNGQDVFAKAFTGSGKTLAFAIPIVKKLTEM